ncbi:MAG: lipopolysaccharide heptosyltransferase I [Phycisphaeraceae bacterium]|nr:lipopolysaccharide heptosyltransferase I [Phycisphaeraceae bacterium]
MPVPAAPARVLLIRPSALGDVCRTVPAAVSLRRAFPGAHIDWLVQEGFEDAVIAHPAVDGVIPFPRERLRRWPLTPSAWRAGAALVHALRRPRYDAVYDLQGLARSGLLARCTGSRHRVGWRSAREGAWLWYSIRHAGPPQVHTVDQMLELLACEGIPVVRDLRLYVPAHGATWWDEERRRRGLDAAGRLVVLAPTARWRSKEWPLERWVEVVPALRASTGATCVVVGTHGERARLAPLLEAPGVVDLVGRTAVGGLMAVISSASLVIANDSAALHIAVGFDRPSVALYGPTDPRRVGPLGTRSRVLGGSHGVSYRAAAMDDRLMQRIGVAAVMSAAVEQLAAHGDAARHPV